MSWGITPLGVEIKKKLIDKHMTQTELARKIGTSKNYITDIIYGKYPLVRSHMLQKILLELKIDVKNSKRR